MSDVVVTGVSNPRSKLESSVSVSTINPKQIDQVASRSSSEVLRYVPGVKVEASAGEGNTNISVRGAPISSGGSKYVQLQEDGLPIMQFGDIAFATGDIFMRIDRTVSKVEAIRGGSASTMASNSPAGIINLISKTGNIAGGSIASTFSVDYNQYRTDFEYGTPLGNDVRVHFGGFYRSGVGPRTAGFTANNGGQFKASITKDFEKGYVRLYAKLLNDRTAAYMPMPIEVTGTNSSPTWKSMKGFDALRGTLHSPYLSQNVGLGENNQLRRADVADGMHPISKSIGAEMVFDLGNGWDIENRTRFSMNNGRFITPFPAAVGNVASMISTVGGATGWNMGPSTLQYANTGESFGGTNAMVLHMFDVELKNMNLYTNDLKLKKKLGIVDVTAGYYRSNQNISMAWLWNSYLSEVSGKNARLLDIRDSAGNVVTDNGLFAYGVPVWVNCCQRSYDVQYQIQAPYANVAIQATENISIDASARWDYGMANGSYSGGSQTRFDVNADGQISKPEESVSSINYAAALPVNYTYDYLSYSAGANVKLNENMAVFGRYSSGAVAKADRLLFGANVFSDGSAVGKLDKIQQAEAGFKSNFKKGGLFITAFYSNVNEEGGYEATTQKVIENDYQSLGAEIEGVYTPVSGLELRGSLTYNHARITNGENKNNQPRRQAPVIFTFMPSYTYKKFSVGLSMFGTGKAYTQDNNELVMPGYVLINPYLGYDINKDFSVSVNANNVFNTLGITEAEEGSITEGQANIIRARSVIGRTVSASVRYQF